MELEKQNSVNESRYRIFEKRNALQEKQIQNFGHNEDLIRRLFRKRTGYSTKKKYSFSKILRIY